MSRKKPPDLRLIHGKPGNRPAPPAGPPVVVVPGAPPMPSWIADDDDVARAEWERVVPLLVERGVLCELDLAVVSEYCLTWSELAALRAELRASGGCIVETERGGMKRHPLMPAIDAAYGRLRWTAGELTLTPLARTRVPVASPPPADPIDDLKRRQRRRRRRPK